MLTRRCVLESMAAGVLLHRRKPGDKPNLLFLWTDEQRADSFRFRMPALNRLAAESIAFQNTYVTQPVCTPSRGSVLTGLYPHQHGCVFNNMPLSPKTRTQPELLADSSYATGYMGKWHLGDEIFPQHGFREWVSIEDAYSAYFSEGRDQGERSSYHHFLTNLNYKPNKDNKFAREWAVRLPIEHCKPAFLAENANRFLMEHRHEPWLLHVNFLEPHMPFDGPLNDLHSAEEAPVPANYPGDQVEGEPELYRRLRKGYVEKGFGGQNLKTREGWQRLNRNYAGLCAQVDQALGRILWTLEATGQAENTVIVFTSDHGEMMGAHSLVGKSVFYEEAVRVPLLIRAPFLKHGAVKVERPVSQVNLVPTILELLGAKAQDQLPGESLMRESPREDHVFIEWSEPLKGPDGRAMVTPEGEKLILYKGDRNMFFDLRRDPLELNNLWSSAGAQGRIASLRKRLEAWSV